MDNPNQLDSRNPDAPAKPRRPNRNSPLYIVTTPDGTKQFMMADKLAEYQAKLAAEDAAIQVEEEARRAAAEAERAAGRAPEPPAAEAAETTADPPANPEFALTERSVSHSNGLRTGRRVATGATTPEIRCLACFLCLLSLRFLSSPRFFPPLPPLPRLCSSRP